MNNLWSFYGLVDARISVSDKDLFVTMRLCDENLILEKNHGSCDLMSLTILMPSSILVKNFYSRIKSFFFFYFLALTKVYEKANSVVSYDVHCPTWLHKYLIGKKGSKLQELIGDLSKQVSNYFWFGFFSIWN